jgi:hypothetical protein
MSRRRFWTAAELGKLRALYPILRAADLALELRRPTAAILRAAYKHKIRKSAEFWQSQMERPAMIAHQFHAGHVPANKGLRRPGWSPGRMRETQFRKGERTGIAARNWVPVGTVMPDSEGYLRIKIREAVFGKEPTGWGNSEAWPQLHRHVWKQERGPIPPGHVIAFKNGKHGTEADCAVENLECVSRGEMARRNRMWNIYPRPLAEAIQLQGVLKGKLRRANAEK